MDKIYKLLDAGSRRAYIRVVSGSDEGRKQSLISKPFSFSKTLNAVQNATSG